MAIFFNPHTKGFYDTRIHNDIPANSVEISEKDHAKLLKLQGQGFTQIVLGTDGRPMAINPDPIEPEEKEVPAELDEPSPEAINSSLREQIAYLEYVEQPRAVREFLLNRPEALKKLQQIDIDITLLRSKLV